MKKRVFLILFILPIVLKAQVIQINKDDEHTEELIELVGTYLPGIVDQSDTFKYNSARNTLIKQYIELREIYETRDEDIKEVESDHLLDSTVRSKNIELIKLKALNEVYVHHAELLGRLRIELNLEEIEKVRSGMTDNILQASCESYSTKYPDMTEAEEKYTYANFYAAQILAMDELSSDNRADIFDDYESRVILYLTEGPPVPEPDDNPEYTQVLIERVDGFLPNIIDKADPRYLHIREIVIRQYKDLARIHDTRDADIESIMSDKSLDFKARSLNINLIYHRAERDVRILHAEYLGRLNSELSIEEVDGIKCWISYNVIGVTYKAYLEQNPNMTEIQKRFTYGYLFAAKELAMDKGSSDEKHDTFRKYKGIINNYLAGLYNPNKHLEISFEDDTTGNPASVPVIPDNSAEKPDVSIYPNPLSGITTIEIKNNKEIGGISLYSINGQKLLNISNTISQGTQRVEFDATELLKGIYFICIELQNDKSVIKVVK
jgi:hypothetical protein